jgi:aerobic carbon-monoxide dehydrogenase medium subunit
MYPAGFSYQRATSVRDAIALLAKEPDAKMLAGGQSLLSLMKLRLASPSTLIDLGGVKELRGIRRDGDTIAIGALTTHREIEYSTELKAACPLLPEAAAQIGDPLVRNRGTIGGAVAHADPAADFPAALLALGATILAEGPKGKRSIAADDFFVGLFTTALQPDELLTAIHVPAAPPAGGGAGAGAGASSRTGMAYEKFPHPASRYAIVGVAAVVSVANGKCSAARVAVTGAGAHAMRLTSLEAALVGKALDEATLTAACQNVVAPDDLLSDQFASSEYRAHLASVLARRALTRAAARTA